MPDLDVVDHTEKHRFEAREEDGTVLGFSQYLRRGDTITFTHTVVADEAEGQGVGSELVRGALDAARSAGLRVVPQCPFVREYVDRHPEYADLVD